MTRLVILLRGVNVGGHGRLPMADWRKVLTAQGFDDVATYIQSGNAVLTSDAPVDQVRAQVQDGIADHFGFRPACIVLTATELASHIAANPFPQAMDDPKSLHLFFLSGPATLDAEGLQTHATKAEAFALLGDCFYLYTPNGFGRSDVAQKLDRYLKAEVSTARNLRSCLKILDLTAEAP